MTTKPRPKLHIVIVKNGKPTNQWKWKMFKRRLKRWIGVL